MLITLLGLAFIALGFILNYIRKKNNFSYRTDNFIESFTFASTFAGALVSIICVVLIIINFTVSDIDYNNKLYEKEIIEYRIEHLEDNVVGNETLYKDIVEFNNELRSTKKYANNIWTSWFNNQNIAKIDFIELPVE